MAPAAPPGVIEAAGSWGRTGIIMTENERRAQDVFRLDDLILRATLALGLIAMFLIALLAAQP